jgi:hypothetical protein
MGVGGWGGVASPRSMTSCKKNGVGGRRGAKPPEYDILQKKWSGVNIIHYIHKMVLLLKYLPLI